MLSLRRKIVLLPATAVIVLGLVAVVLQSGAVYSALRTRMLEQSRSATAYLAAAAAEPLLGYDTARLTAMLDDFRTRQSGDADYAFVLDQENVIMAHIFAAGVPLALVGAHQLAAGA
ncbi:MAG TPA: hypothetical protein PKM88_14720, partial [bacterium]|nr:hypothetical protein [bacterium]